MDWLNQLGGLLQQYSGAQPAQAPDTVEDDFDQLTQAAPESALADGISAAFRSEQTPPFGQMLGQLFNQSSGTQRAGILNTLISALGPAFVSQILARAGGGGGLAGMLGGGQTEVTPEQAEAIPPQVVEEVANEAEKRDPSVVDMVSNVYAKNPTLFKALGAAALTVALAKIADRQQRG